MKIFNWLLIIFNNLNSLINCLVLLYSESHAFWHHDRCRSSVQKLLFDQPFRDKLCLSLQTTQVLRED